MVKKDLSFFGAELVAKAGADEARQHARGEASGHGSRTLVLTCSGGGVCGGTAIQSTGAEGCAQLSAQHQLDPSTEIKPSWRSLEVPRSEQVEALDATGAGEHCEADDPPRPKEFYGQR